MSTQIARDYCQCACQHPTCWESFRKAEQGYVNLSSSSKIRLLSARPDHAVKLPTQQIVNLPDDWEEHVSFDEHVLADKFHASVHQTSLPQDTSRSKNKASLQCSERTQQNKRFIGAHKHSRRRNQLLGDSTDPHNNRLHVINILNPDRDDFHETASHMPQFNQKLYVWVSRDLLSPNRKTKRAPKPFLVNNEHVLTKNDEEVEESARLTTAVDHSRMLTPRVLNTAWNSRQSSNVRRSLDASRESTFEHIVLPDLFAREVSLLSKTENKYQNESIEPEAGSERAEMLKHQPTTLNHDGMYLPSHSAANIFGQSVMKKRMRANKLKTSSTAFIHPEEFHPAVSSMSSISSRTRPTPKSLEEFNLKSGLFVYHGPQVTPATL